MIYFMKSFKFLLTEAWWYIYVWVDQVMIVFDTLTHWPLWDFNDIF